MGLFVLSLCLILYSGLIKIPESVYQTKKMYFEILQVGALELKFGIKISKSEGSKSKPAT